MQTAILRIPTSSEVGSWCSSLQKDLLSSTFRILRIPASSDVGSWCSSLQKICFHQPFRILRIPTSSDVGSWCSSLQKICFHQRFAFFAYPPRQRWVADALAYKRSAFINVSHSSHTRLVRGGSVLL